jgi:hypothetical protein
LVWQSVLCRYSPPPIPVDWIRFMYLVMNWH